MRGETLRVIEEVAFDPAPRLPGDLLGAVHLREPRAGPPVRPARARPSWHRRTTSRVNAAADQRPRPGCWARAASSPSSPTPPRRRPPSGASSSANRCCARRCPPPPPNVEHQAAQGRRRQRGAHHPAEAGGAPQEPALQRLPQVDGPAGSGLRGLRRHRRRPQHRGRPAHRHQRRARRQRLPPAGRAGRAAGAQRPARGLRGALAVPLRPGPPGERGRGAAAGGAGRRICSRRAIVSRRWWPTWSRARGSAPLRDPDAPLDAKRKEFPHDLASVSPAACPGGRCCAGRWAAPRSAWACPRCRRC